MEVFLVRHTKVDIEKDICYGQSNVSLAPSFIEELKVISQKLPQHFDCVYSSPLDRCTHLAHGLGFKDFIISDLLKELNFGNWEGKKWTEINQRDLQEWMNDFVNVSPQNGESLQMLFHRTRSFLNELRNNHIYKRVLLITHAGFIRCALAEVLQIPLQNIFKIPIEYGNITIMELSGQKKFETIKKF